MIVISYDISDDKCRSKFTKMLTKNGAIRLQFSVYEINNTNRVLDNIKLLIEEFSKNFSADDSVVIFDVANIKLTKYGNAIHRDQDVVFI